MSIPAKHWALAQSVPGSSSNRIILYFLAEWVIGEDAVECWPSIQTLCFETGMNRQTVMKATASLEAAGLIEKRRMCFGLKWETHYILKGYAPSEWADVRRPTAIGDRVRKSEKPDVRKDGCPKSHTSEGTENRTSGSTKSRTFEGTKNRTRTGNTQGLDREDNRDCVGGASAPAPASDSLFPEDEPKKKPATTRRKPETACPWEEGSAVPEDLRDWCRENCPTLDPQAEFDALVGHAHTHDRRCRDWKAAYRTWCRKAVQMNRSASASGPVHKTSTGLVREKTQEERQANGGYAASYQRALERWRNRKVATA